MKVKDIKGKDWVHTRKGIWHRTFHGKTRSWPQIYYEKKCIDCGDLFVASHKWITYCSKKCSTKNQKSGKESHRWRGGTYIDRTGYRLILRRDHPFARKPNFYIAEHRLVAEKMLGRYLKRSEIVHHLNGIKTDNRPKNLVVLTQSEHIRKFHSPDFRKRL